MTTIAILQKLAAFAAAQGKSLDQLTTALLDTGNGEFERIKEFGIQVVRMTVDGQVHIQHQGKLHTLADTPDALSAFVLALPVTYSLNELADQAWQLRQQLKITSLDSVESRNLRFSLSCLSFTLSGLLSQMKSL